MDVHLTWTKDGPIIYSQSRNREIYMLRKYIGPKGYGSSPEVGGDPKLGRYRMQSVDRIEGRLTKGRKEKILTDFESWNADVVKIDRTSIGRVRIWYNNDVFWKDQ